MPEECPECGSRNVMVEGGCPTCIECSWGKCA